MSRNSSNKESWEEIKCEDCGRTLYKKDFGKTWNLCDFCKVPVCLSCLHHLGATVKELYQDYVSIMRSCKKCYIKR